MASQLLDIQVFDRLRHGTWWRAPLVATVLAALLDSLVFWSIGFAGTGGPWITWALGDLAVKLVLAIFFAHLVWLYYHYQKQNWGLLAFAAAGSGVRLPRSTMHLLMLPPLAGAAPLEDAGEKRSAVLGTSSTPLASLATMVAAAVMPGRRLRSALSTLSVVV